MKKKLFTVLAFTLLMTGCRKNSLSKDSFGILAMTNDEMVLIINDTESIPILRDFAEDTSQEDGIIVEDHYARMEAYLGINRDWTQELNEGFEQTPQSQVSRHPIRDDIDYDSSSGLVDEQVSGQLAEPVITGDYENGELSLIEMNTVDALKVLQERYRSGMFWGDTEFTSLDNVVRMGSAALVFQIAELVFGDTAPTEHGDIGAVRLGDIIFTPDGTWHLVHDFKSGGWFVVDVNVEGAVQWYRPISMIDAVGARVITWH